MFLYHQTIFSITLRVFVSIKISYKTQHQFLIQILQWLQTPSLSPCLAWSLRKTAFPCRIPLAPYDFLKTCLDLIHSMFGCIIYNIYYLLILYMGVLYHFSQELLLHLVEHHCIYKTYIFASHLPLCLTLMPGGFSVRDLFVTTRH